jgi:DNA-binding PucR family transcriptional regulator
LLDARRTDGISIAVGEQAPGVAGFRNSHAEALAARRLARLSEHRAGSVTRWGSVAVLGLLSAAMERAREFVSRELRPLDADDDANGAAAGDARSLLPRGRRAATAQRLGVHINTISYRLRRCEELLERPVKQRRFELEAALLLCDLMAISLAVARPEER